LISLYLLKKNPLSKLKQQISTNIVDVGI